MRSLPLCTALLLLGAAAPSLATSFAAQPGTVGFSPDATLAGVVTPFGVPLPAGGTAPAILETGAPAHSGVRIELSDVISQGTADPATLLFSAMTISAEVYFTLTRSLSITLELSPFQLDLPSGTFGYVVTGPGELSGAVVGVGVPSVPATLRTDWGDVATTVTVRTGLGTFELHPETGAIFHIPLELVSGDKTLALVDPVSGLTHSVGIETATSRLGEIQIAMDRAPMTDAIPVPESASALLLLTALGALRRAGRRS